MSTKGDIGR